eukprot:2278401-Rhodomonas_salina.1
MASLLDGLVDGLVDCRGEYDAEVAFFFVSYIVVVGWVLFNGLYPLMLALPQKLPTNYGNSQCQR